jgi:hypothetical protein
VSVEELACVDVLEVVYVKKIAYVAVLVEKEKKKEVKNKNYKDF